MYKNIPGMKESGYELETMLRKEFDVTFMHQIYKAIEMLHREGEWVREGIVKEFRNTSELFTP
jgi:hypothetical protein